MNNQQRNELCHCGSGKKYKNCCMRKDEAQAQLSRQQFDVRRVIGPNTTPYAFWKRWSAACGRFYDQGFNWAVPAGASRFTLDLR